ncbi:MAG TPA: calcium-binding protein [Actinomycetota bacterium]
MRRKVKLAWLVGAVVSVALLALPPAPAGADHNNDIHSPNISYIGTAVNTDPMNPTNSDLAFWGNRAYVADYNGFRIIDITNPLDIADPSNVIADVVCPGPQFDISVWDNDGDPAADLLFASVDTPKAGPDCGEANTTASNVESWEGVRIFDINDEENPVQIAAVPTDCGSHTHTIAGETTIADVDYLVIWVSSYPLGGGAVTTSIPARADVEVDSVEFDFPAGVRDNGTECLEPEPGEAKPNGVHDKISIIRVPLNDPAAADDRTPNDPDPGEATNWVYTNVREQTLPLAGIVTHINIGGRYFDVTACHDINTFLEINRAAGACWAEGIIWDITNPWQPTYLRRVRQPDVDTLFHSATFSYDGKIIVFEDEAGGGGENRCKLEDGEPDRQGAMYFYKMNGVFQGRFKIPRQATGICTAHNYNTVPTTDGRRIAVSAWYTGGTSVIDYTDPTNPKEIGFYRANSPVNGVGPDVGANTWSSYWYNGFIWANDIVRSLDLFSFDDPRVESAIDLPHLNPQVQENVIQPVIPRCMGQEATIFGTSSGDVLTGTAGRDVIAGLGGNDLIRGRGGNDLICGGAGADTIRGNAGDDRIQGQGSRDTLFGNKGNDVLNGGPARDSCLGGPGRDRARNCERTRGIP